MLENYGFPWGNKRELEWALEASDKALERERNALRQLERQYYELQDELHERHILKLQPLAEEAANLTNMSVFIDNHVSFDADILSVRLAIKHYKAHEHSAMDYTRRAIDQVSHMLANKFVTRIADGLRECYLKMKGDKGDF